MLWDSQEPVYALRRNHAEKKREFVVLLTERTPIPFRSFTAPCKNACGPPLTKMVYGRLLNNYVAKNPFRSLAAGAAANAAYRAAGHYLDQNKKDTMAKTASKMGMRRKSRTRSRRKSSGNNSYVTTQRDTVKQYRYRRMPRYKRKRWVKKVKANAAMDFALAGTRTSVYNGSLQMPIRAEFSQGLLAVHLYGNNGNGATVNGYDWEYGQSDINYLIGVDDKIITTGQKLSKFRFTSGVIDITARNSSLNNLSLEVDLYMIKYKSETDFTSFYRMHQEAISRIQNVNGTPDNPLTMEQRGVTPFDIPALAAMGMKIISKQKFFLPNGDTFTYQYRDPRNHPYGTGSKYDNDGFILPGVTTTFLCVFKPVVGGTVADARLTVGATRTYRYGIIGENQLVGDFYG